MEEPVRQPKQQHSDHCRRNHKQKARDSTHPARQINGRIIVYKRIWHNKRNEQLNRNRVNRNRIFNKSPNLINKNVHQVICPHVFNAQRAEKNNDRRLNQTASKDNQCQYQNQVQADSDRQLVQTEYQHIMNPNTTWLRDPRNNHQALQKIAEFYRIDTELKELPATDRLTQRQTRIKPLVEDFFAWAEYSGRF